MKVAVLADTHVRDSGSTVLSGQAWALLRSADAILHAGDIVEAGFLAALRAVAPVHAVLGNNDGALAGLLPESLEVVLGGVPVAMVHDGGPRAGREGRLHRRFPRAAVVVFGHSHMPWNAPGVDGQLLFNPGSATQRRRQPHRTAGWLELGRGRIAAADIIEVD